MPFRYQKGRKMAVTSEVGDSERVIEVDFDFDGENGSPKELISYLKVSFRDSDFAKVESILTAREAKLRLEIETKQQASDRLEQEGMEKHGVQEKLLELQKLNFALTQEKNIVYERLRKAENEAETWKNKYLQLESRISDLEADSKMLLNVDRSELNVRVSGENAKGAKLEREANADRDCNGDQEPPSRSIVVLIDSDDDCATGESSSKIEMNPKNVHSGQKGEQSARGKLKRKLDACLSVHENKIDNNVENVEGKNSATADCNEEKLLMLTHEHNGSGQTGLQSGTGMLKSKLDACLSVSKNKIDNSFDDVEVNNSATADCKTEKFQMLTPEHAGSPVRHYSSTAIPPHSNDVETLHTPSSQGPVILKQCEEKMEQEHTSQNLKRDYLSGFHTGYDIEDSSSSSSSSSDSDDDWDLDFDFSRLIGTQNDKNWKSEADMLAAFVKDNKLYLQAVCALYRQQTSIGKPPLSSSSTNNRGFSHSNAHRGTALAEFLMDGDLQGKLKKSIPELQQYDEKGLDDCKKLAIEHSKQLFEIYQKKEDPLFFS